MKAKKNAKINGFIKFILSIPKCICCFAVRRVLSLMTIFLAFVLFLCLATALISWFPGFQNKLNSLIIKFSKLTIFEKIGFITGILQVRSSVQNLFDDIGVRGVEFMRTMLEENRKSALSLKREWEQGSFGLKDSVFSSSWIVYLLCFRLVNI